ncbi:MAG TPA: HAD-IA family hydrolase [Actinomycetes bacterium]|nr:HAD-IA family hydrolase [Actinomycetes bacterium]
MTRRWATFDCYGTLIDWEGGIRDTFARLWPGADGAALLVAYHRMEPEVQRGRAIPYRQVLAETLAGVAAEAGLPLAGDRRDALTESLPSWRPFPEVPAALAALRSRGWRLAILSNTDPDLLAASVHSIGVPADVRVTAAEAGSYKPAHGHWRYFFDRTGTDRDQHVHVAASLTHDIAPCAELGLTAVWINRTGDATDRTGAADLPRAAELPDLEALPDTLDRLRQPTA